MLYKLASLFSKFGCNAFCRFSLETSSFLSRVLWQRKASKVSLTKLPASEASDGRLGPATLRGARGAAEGGKSCDKETRKRVKFWQVRKFWWEDLADWIPENLQVSSPQSPESSTQFDGGWNPGSILIKWGSYKANSKGFGCNIWRSAYGMFGMRQFLRILSLKAKVAPCHKGGMLYM